MNNIETKVVVLDAPEQNQDRKKRWFAAIGVIAAFLASTCCIVPLVFVMLGISGAWISNLTAFEPYKPLFAGVALVFIGFGFREVYFKPKLACEGGTYCGRPQSALVTKFALWLATALVALALTINWWAPYFY